MALGVYLANTNMNRIQQRMHKRLSRAKSLVETREIHLMEFLEWMVWIHGLCQQRDHSGVGIGQTTLRVHLDNRIGTFLGHGGEVLVFLVLLELLT